MSITTKQRIAAKKLLMDELKACGASSEIIFKFMAKVDRTEDGETLISDLSKAFALLVNVRASAALAVKMKEILASWS